MKGGEIATVPLGEYHRKPTRIGAGKRLANTGETRDETCTGAN